MSGHASTVSSDLTWRSLSGWTRFYLTVVIVAGVSTFAAFFPLTVSEPIVFGALVMLTCLTSAWKVNLPISLASGATLSASYAANLMALLLLGPSHAVVIGVVGAWTQCTYKVKRRYPLYRTIFSTAAEALQAGSPVTNDPGCVGSAVASWLLTADAQPPGGWPGLSWPSVTGPGGCRASSPLQW